MKSITGIVLIVLAQETFAQLLFPGQCPKFKNPVEKSFDIDEFTGVWFGIKKYPSPTIFRCTRGFYKNNYNGTLTVYDTGYDVNTGKPISAIYYGRIFNGPNLAIRFLPSQTLDKPNNIIVGIDHKSWVATVICTNISKTQYLISALIGSRKYPMDQDALEKAYAALKHAKVDLSKLMDYDQRNCTY